jgi:hypothetical protein
LESGYPKTPFFLKKQDTQAFKCHSRALIFAGVLLAKARTTKITRTRRYRVTKKNPRHPRVIMKLDRGNVEQQITLTFPEKTRFHDVEMPKEHNPDLMSLRLGDMKLVWYFKDDKGWIYDCDGIFSGRFLKHDLKHAFYQIGTILKTVQRQKG